MREFEAMTRPRAWIGPACLALLPLAVWPGLETPFSSPKLIWVVASTVALLAIPSSAPSAPLPPALRWAAVGWISAFLLAGLAAPLPAFPPVVLGVTAPLFALALVRGGVAPLPLMTAQVLGATACSVVALAQWAGLDPFLLLGWHAPIDGASVRMRVYGTLGNPNFVGVLAAMSLAMTLALAASATTSMRRRLAWTALVVLAAALVATGSRGAVLGLGAAVAAYAFLRWSRRVRIGVAAVALFAGVAIAVSPARPIDTTAAGRVYLWRVVSPRAWEAPFVGHGPGAVTLQFPRWQREAARDGVRDRRFAGLTDHVHNDYLEALVERGVPGLLSLLAPLIAVLVVAIRRARPASPVFAGATAAMVAGAACALVDFPLARPTELVCWWGAIAIALQASAAESTPVTTDTGHV
jgi:O-antigen ligase